MKKISLRYLVVGSLLLATFGVWFGFNNPVKAVLGMTAGYSFDEGFGTVAGDSSGNGLTGTLNNTSWTANGKYGSALSFNGSASYVSLGNPATLQFTGSMTVSAWVNSASFPVDDAGVVSKRGSTEDGYQLDTTIDKGPRTIGFKLTSATGPLMARYGATAMVTNQWYYVTGVYDATAQTIHVYLNGALDDGVLVGTVTATQQNSALPVTIGKRAGLNGFEFSGKIDEVRLYNRALTQSEIQTDMATPIGNPPVDTTPPTVSVTAPANNAVVSGAAVTVSATAADNVSVAGVQFLLDGANLGAQDTTSPYSITWNTTTASSGSHALSAIASDSAGNTATASNINVTVDNTPPTGSIVINGGAAATNSTASTLTLSATDALSAVTQMRFSNTGSSFSAAENYATTKAWALTTGAGTKTVYVQFKDAQGNWSGSFTDTIVLDTTAPTISAVASSNITGNSARITWTTNEPATSQVEYGLTNSYGTLTTIDNTLVTSHTVVLSGLTASTNYKYRVRSKDAAGNEGIGSNNTFTTTSSTDTIAPSVPTGLTVTPVSISQINLSWTASTDNVGVTGYKVFRAASQIATVTTGTTYSNTGLTPNTSYTYTVSAYDAANNNSAQSAPASATTLPDTTAPTVSITSPANNSQPTGTIAVNATAADNVAVAGVTFQVDGANITAEDTTSPYSVNLNTTALSNGNHVLTAIARDTANNTATSAPITIIIFVDNQAPQVLISSPLNNAQVTDIITITADADDNVGVAGVKFFVDGGQTGSEDVSAPYGVNWDTRSTTNGVHALTAVARDAVGNTTTSSAVSVNVSNNNYFQNEILATNFSLPTNIEFLPDGRMLVGEIAGKIKILPPPYTTPDPTPFLDLALNIPGYAGLQQGIFDIALDPSFTANHYYYVFYTKDVPNRDRLSRFTANATLTGTIAGSETILYQDPQDANTEHHGGAVNFGNDGKIYFTTGEHFNGANSQDLTSPRGKIHRINPDGTIPNDDPFYDGAGPHFDSIWALGLRNPFRAYYDSPTGRFYIADVGGNDYSTAQEEVDLGAAGKNYGWPSCELGTCNNPNYTAALFAYPHNGRDASITGGFIYHGTQFPSSYQGNYFYADYAQNWIRRLTFDASGNVTGSFNFEPIDGSLDGPYGDIVYLTEGPDGALYYVDLGYSDVGGTFGISKIRRIRYIQTNQAPIAVASANPTEGPKPLTVNFSSAGSSDPEGQPLTYAWTFGDGGTSTQANPSYTYTQAGPYTVRLTVSDGVNNTLAPPVTISVGVKPVPTILTPLDNATFRAGDVISFSGDANDAEDGSLPASAYTWNIDFLHAGHVHPGAQFTGVKSGTFTIPTSGHDFSGNTRYRFMLTVTDSDGLQSSTSVIVYPQKVNLTFGTVPAGLTLTLDSISHATPFVYDTLIGFNHTIGAPNATVGSNVYTFASWSDGGAQNHTLVVPASDQGYTATYSVSQVSVPPVVDASSHAQAISASALSWSHTTTSIGSNVVLVVNTSTRGNVDASRQVVSVTYGGQPLTLLRQDNSSPLSTSMWYKVAPLTGPNMIVVTYGGATENAVGMATSLIGVNQATPVNSSATALGADATGGSAGVTTTANNTLVMDTLYTKNDLGATAGSGQTAQTSIISGPNVDSQASSVKTLATAGATTMSWTWTNDGVEPWILSVAAFNPAN